MRRTRGLVAAFALALAAGMTTTGTATAAPQADATTRGGRLLYIDLTGSGDSGVGALKSATPTGQDVHDFGRQLPWYSSPSYSPDGEHIAYIGGDLGFSVMLMNADGSGDHWLIDAPFGPAFPRWAPDGQSIIYQFDGLGEVPVEGQTWQQLTPPEDAELMGSYAPSGDRLATTTVGSDSAPGAVRIRSADGQQILRTVPLDGAHELDWSPTGRQIAVSAAGDLYLVNPDTGAVRRLTSTPDLQESSPTWSPDGSRLAYSVDPGSSPETHNSSASQVWMMDSKGRHRHSTGLNGVPTSWTANAG